MNIWVGEIQAEMAEMWEGGGEDGCQLRRQNGCRGDVQEFQGVEGGGVEEGCEEGVLRVDGGVAGLLGGGVLMSTSNGVLRCW